MKKVIKRDSEKTKANILLQATQCFAQNGYHGAGLNEICRKSKVNKRMIYHYFGNKDGLYRAVHLACWQELQAWFLEALNRASAESTPLKEDTAILLETLTIFHDFIASHPAFVRLLMWDGLEGGHISRSLWNEIRGPIYRQLEMLVTAVQEAGKLSKDLMASHLIISFMGSIAFYFSHAHTMGDIFRKDTLSPEAIEERKEQVLALFRKIMT